MTLIPDHVTEPDGRIDLAVLAELERQAAGGVPPPPAAKPQAAPQDAAAVKVDVAGAAGKGVVIGGAGALIVAFDQLLRDHGETLETLTAAGPLTGALLQYWPLLILAYFAWRAAAERWREHVLRQQKRDAIDAAARAGQDEQLRAQTRLLRVVARNLDNVAAGLDHLQGKLAETDSRTAAEAVDLRRHVDGIAVRVSAIEAKLTGAGA